MDYVGSPGGIPDFSPILIVEEAWEVHGVTQDKVSSV
jgi:hypothetical protein